MIHHANYDRATIDKVLSSASIRSLLGTRIECLSISWIPLVTLYKLFLRIDDFTPPFIDDSSTSSYAQHNLYPNFLDFDLPIDDTSMSQRMSELGDISHRSDEQYIDHRHRRARDRGRSRVS